MLRLNPDDFNVLIRDMGQRVLYRAAIMCPCRDPHSGAAQQDCPTCHGRGVFWRQGTQTHLALTSLKQAREYRDFGLIEGGDVIFTIPSDSAAYLAGESDQFMLIQSDMPWTGIFTRGAPDERWPPGVFQVQDITGLDAQRAPVAYRTPRLPPLDAGGAPIWPAAGAPPAGQQYSVRARRRPVFFLLRDLPQSRQHHGGAALPRRVAARTLDLFGRDAA
jgi:hypothetical protein